MRTIIDDFNKSDIDDFGDFIDNQIYTPELKEYIEDNLLELANEKSQTQELSIKDYVDLIKNQQIIYFHNLEESNVYIKFISSLGQESKIILPTIETTKDHQKYSIKMGFSDYIKCKIILETKKDLRLPTKEVLRFARLLNGPIESHVVDENNNRITFDDLMDLSYDYPSIGAILSDKNINKNLIEHISFFSEEDFNLYKNPQTAYKKLLKKFSLQYNHKTDDNFAKAIYHIIAYDKEIFISYYIPHAIGEDRIDYYMSNTIGSNLSGHTYNIRINSFLNDMPKINTTNNEKLDFTANLLSEKYNKNYSALGVKNDLLKEKIKKYDSVKNNKQISREKVRKLMLTIEKIESEIALGDYSIEGYIGKNNEDNKVGYLPDLINMNEFAKELGNFTEGTLTTEIKNKTIIKIEVFRKERSISQKELREQYPFAEIGGQQYGGKTDYATVRYKKDLKKTRKNIL